MKKKEVIEISPPKHITSLIVLDTDFECAICGECDNDEMVDPVHIVRFEDGSIGLVCPNCADGLEKLLETTEVNVSNNSEFLECVSVV